MKSIFISTVAALILCVGCSAKPAESDVAGALNENVPVAFKTLVTVEQTQAEITASSDEAIVKFKSHLKLSQSLFKPVDFESIAKSTDSDVALFSQIEEAA